MKIEIKKCSWKNIMPLVGILMVNTISISSLEAKGLEPSTMPSVNLPKNLTMPSKAEIIQKRLKINKNNLPKSQSTKPIVKISAPRGGKMLREIDYYQNGKIVIPFSASIAYDSKGNNLSGSSLSWSYVIKKGTGWVTFGQGQSVQLKLDPDSTNYHNNIYKVGIRLTAKDPWNGLTSASVVSLSIQAIAK